MKNEKKELKKKEKNTPLVGKSSSSCWQFISTSSYCLHLLLGWARMFLKKKKKKEKENEERKKKTHLWLPMNFGSC
jgi:hypothetical protein